MTLFLQILGAIFLSMVLTIAIVYFYFRWKLRRAFSDMGDAIKELGKMMKGLETMPARIHVRRDEDPEPFDDADKESAVAQPLLGAGFTDLGYYTIDEMPQVKLRALMSVEQAVYAVVCEMDGMGVWLDLTCKYPDGYDLTYSTSQETGLERPPNMPAVRFPGADAGTLLRKMLDGRRPGPFLPVSADEFPRRVEQGHAEEVEWRATQGGSSEEEIKRVAAKTGTEMDEGMLQIAARMEANRNAMQLDQVLRARYLESKGITDHENFEATGEPLVFIHDRRKTDELVALYLGALGVDDEDEDNSGRRESAYKQARNFAGNAPPREAFARLNTRLPQGRQFVKVGELTAPVAADVYQAPWPIDGDDDDIDE